jgi:hypothetical protein
MQSNTTGGAFYDGLQITNNINSGVECAKLVRLESLRGIWENGHAHTSKIHGEPATTFTNQAAGNSPATNLQRGFRVNVAFVGIDRRLTYQNNTVSGANIGYRMDRRCSLQRKPGGGS